MWTFPYNWERFAHLKEIKKRTISGVERFYKASWNKCQKQWITYTPYVLIYIWVVCVVYIKFCDIYFRKHCKTFNSGTAFTLNFISMMVSLLNGELAEKLQHIFSVPTALWLHEVVYFCIVALSLVSCISNLMTLKQMKHKYV